MLTPNLDKKNNTAIMIAMLTIKKGNFRFNDLVGSRYSSISIIFLSLFLKRKFDNSIPKENRPITMIIIFNITKYPVSPYNSLYQNTKTNFHA